MVDVDRDVLLSDVLGRLVDPRFARLLTATTPSGDRPIMPAVYSDAFVDILAKVSAAGGCGNMVVAMPQGYLVMGLAIGPAQGAGMTGQQVLKRSCTVGLVLARLMADGGGPQTYLVPGIATHRRERATANLVGAAS